MNGTVLKIAKQARLAITILLFLFVLSVLTVHSGVV